MSKKGPPKAANAPKLEIKKSPVAAVADAAASVGKSIVDPKYRNRYKENGPDWLGEVIIKAVQPLVEKKQTTTEGEDKVTKVVKVPGPIDTEALFQLAEANHLDVAKYKAQADTHGFAGRIRMTIRNMLQATVKARHGLYVGDKWVKADPDWLAAKGAPEVPTHGKDGTKLAVKKPKVEKEAEAA